MEPIKIKLKIAEREYPLTVQPAEEERIRKASKLINERIAFYKERMRVADMQDLLAMVAFDSLMNKLDAENHATGLEQSIFTQLEKVDRILGKALQQAN